MSNFTNIQNMNFQIPIFVCNYLTLIFSGFTGKYPRNTLCVCSFLEKILKHSNTVAYFSQTLKWILFLLDIPKSFSFFGWKGIDFYKTL